MRQFELTHYLSVKRRMGTTAIMPVACGGEAVVLRLQTPELVPLRASVGSTEASASLLARVGVPCLRFHSANGNLGLPDGNARYNLPPADIQRLVAGFIAEVSGG